MAKENGYNLEGKKQKTNSATHLKKRPKKGLSYPQNMSQDNF